MIIRVDEIYFWDDDNDKKVAIRAGDVVWDGLTNRPAKIIALTKDENNNEGIWLNNHYLHGGRFPWEISLIRNGEYKEIFDDK